MKLHEDALNKLKLTKAEKEKKNKIALGTCKLNYIDPRITIAW